MFEWDVLSIRFVNFICVAVLCLLILQKNVGICMEMQNLFRTFHSIVEHFFVCPFDLIIICYRYDMTTYRQVWFVDWNHRSNYYYCFVSINPVLNKRKMELKEHNGKCHEKFLPKWMDHLEHFWLFSTVSIYRLLLSLFLCVNAVKCFHRKYIDIDALKY